MSKHIHAIKIDDILSFPMCLRINFLFCSHKSCNLVNRIKKWSSFPVIEIFSDRSVRPNTIQLQLVKNKTASPEGLGPIGTGFLNSIRLLYKGERKE